MSPTPRMAAMKIRNVSHHEMTRPLDSMNANKMMLPVHLPPRRMTGPTPPMDRGGTVPMGIPLAPYPYHQQQNPQIRHVPAACRIGGKMIKPMHMPNYANSATMPSGVMMPPGRPHVRNSATRARHGPEGAQSFNDTIGAPEADEESQHLHSIYTTYTGGRHVAFPSSHLCSSLASGTWPPDGGHQVDDSVGTLTEGSILHLNKETRQLHALISEGNIDGLCYPHEDISLSLFSEEEQVALGVCTWREFVEESINLLRYSGITHWQQTKVVPAASVPSKGSGLASERHFDANSRVDINNQRASASGSCIHASLSNALSVAESSIGVQSSVQIPRGDNLSYSHVGSSHALSSDSTTTGSSWPYFVHPHDEPIVERSLKPQPASIVKRTIEYAELMGKYGGDSNLRFSEMTNCCRSFSLLRLRNSVAATGMTSHSIGCKVAGACPDESNREDGFGTNDTSGVAGGLYGVVATRQEEEDQYLQGLDFAASLQYKDSEVSQARRRECITWLQDVVTGCYHWSPSVFFVAVDILDHYLMRRCKRERVTEQSFQVSLTAALFVAVANEESRYQSRDIPSDFVEQVPYLKSVRQLFEKEIEVVSELDRGLIVGRCPYDIVLHYFHRIRFCNILVPREIRGALIRATCDSNEGSASVAMSPHLQMRAAAAEEATRLYSFHLKTQVSEVLGSDNGSASFSSIEGTPTPTDVAPISIDGVPMPTGQATTRNLENMSMLELIFDGILALCFKSYEIGIYTQVPAPQLVAAIFISVLAAVDEMYEDSLANAESQSSTQPQHPGEETEDLSLFHSYFALEHFCAVIFQLDWQSGIAPIVVKLRQLCTTGGIRNALVNSVIDRVRHLRLPLRPPIADSAVYCPEKSMVHHSFATNSIWPDTGVSGSVGDSSMGGTFMQIEMTGDGTSGGTSNAVSFTNMSSLRGYEQSYGNDASTPLDNTDESMSLVMGNDIRGDSINKKKRSVYPELDYSPAASDVSGEEHNSDADKRVREMHGLQGRIP